MVEDTGRSGILLATAVFCPIEACVVKFERGCVKQAKLIV